MWYKVIFKTHFILELLGIKPRALYVLGKHSSTELLPQPFDSVHFNKGSRALEKLPSLVLLIFGLAIYSFSLFSVF